MMHEWQSQEKLLEEVKQPEIMEVLHYSDFRYEVNEWDNVPPVLPRFHFYNQAYMRGIVEFCYSKSKEESTKSLREYITAEFADV